MDYETQPDEQPVIDASQPDDLSEPSVEPIYIEPPVTALKLDRLTVNELRQYAAENGIDLGGARTHIKIVDAIMETIAPWLPPEEAAPVAPKFDFSELYGHMPDGFYKTLTNALHARGIIEPGDYFKAGAPELFRSAMLSVIKHDFLSVQTLAKTAWIERAEGRSRK
ncbi:MAG: hypothetical protein ABI690_13535 [Chloroflexota bacterium]